MILWARRSVAGSSVLGTCYLWIAIKTSDGNGARSFHQSSVASKNSNKDDILAQECQAQISYFDRWLVVVSCTLPPEQLAKQPSTVRARIRRSALRLMEIIEARLLPSQAASR